MFLILTLLVMGSFSPFFSSGYAQEFQSSDIKLFVPEKMIAGQTYQGMVTLINPSYDDSLILLSTTDDFILESDSSVFVNANQNHGIFEIIPHNEGQANIFASYDGQIVSSTATVYSEKSGAKNLKVILPGTRTITDELMGYVFLLDGNGFPIKSDFDRTINLISSEKIIVPDQIIILNGTTNSNFDVIVRAAGEITATGPRLISSTATINKSQQTVDVKIAIAPNIALGDSYVNYFVWLEQNNRPYTVPHVLKVELQSSNTDVLRLGVSPSSYKNVDTVTISMNDGMASGRLYTGDSGIAQVFASVPDYGHASTLVNVGPAVLSEGQIISDEISSGSSEVEPNHIQFWVYPEITDDVAYGVAALYYSESNDSLDVSLDEDGTQVTNLVEHTTLIPVKTEDILISISSESGLEHNSDYLLDDVQFPTHSKIFEIIAHDVGDYAVTATGGKSFDSANLSVTTSQNSQYFIQTTPLPISSGLTQPLMMVSIVDEDQNIIEISELFDSSLVLNVDSINSKIGSSKLHLSDNVGVVSGIVNGFSTVNVSSDSLGTLLTELSPSGIPISLEFLIPDSIHSGESFPITIHEIDAGGIPISKKQTELMSSSGFDKIEEGIISVNGIGEQQISILGKLGGAFQTIVESFTNEIIFDVSADIENVRVGEKVTIKIDSPINDVDYVIDSPFPYEKLDDNTFLVVPDYEVVDAEIIITGHLDGFSTSSNQLFLSSENIVEISTNAITRDGKTLSPTYDIHLGSDVKSTTAPEKHIVKPQQLILEFPKDYSTVAGGYRLVELKINDNVSEGNIVDFFADGDNLITAIYEKFVQVTIHDGAGSGIYPYGQTIKISASDKQKMSFLVVEKFDYWIGADKPSSFTVNGQEDIEITAIYRDDYTGLMIVILVGVIAIALIIFKKTSDSENSDSFAYYMGDYVEKILGKIKPIIPFGKK